MKRINITCNFTVVNRYTCNRSYNSCVCYITISSMAPNSYTQTECCLSLFPFFSSHSRTVTFHIHTHTRWVNWCNTSSLPVPCGGKANMLRNLFNDLHHTHTHKGEWMFVLRAKASKSPSLRQNERLQMCHTKANQCTLRDEHVTKSQLQAKWSHNLFLLLLLLLLLYEYFECNFTSL